MLMDWAHSRDTIALALDSGEIRQWDYKEANELAKLFSVPPKGATVLRWHPRDAIRLLVCTSDGSLQVFDQRVGKKPTVIVGRSKTSKDPVTDAQWDPLSDDYLLAAFGDGSLVLIDAREQKEIHSFEKQPQGIKSLAWAKAQPGNFITATDKVGVLKLWNVSQRSPLWQIKVGATGVTCIKAVPTEPNWFILAFKNSAVGVCDIGNRTMRFTSCPGHSETIFDVVFHPDDPDMLATASYDGRVKVWRTSTMEAHREMYAGPDQLLYGLTFGPKASRVCAVSSKGLLFVWKTETGEQLHRLDLHHGSAAYRCEWNMLGATHSSGEIATGGHDGIACVVDASTGNVLRRITHPGAVVGVAWHPFEDGVLATGCQDGIVRIFYLREAGPVEDPKPRVQLSGHEARVFNIAFHPICSPILASGSDDKTIRVWSWSPSGPRELYKLVGHTSYVRGLLWHSELPNILFSGSWDSTIRVWNVVERQCLHVSCEHHADVYGLNLHPKRPFVLASSSRDTTIRFWIYEDRVRPLLTQAVVRPDCSGDILGNPEEATDILLAGGAANVPLRLYGSASRRLFTEITALLQQGPPSLQVYQKIVSFFMYRQGMEDLWGLLAVLRGEPSPGAGPSRTIFHEQELIQCQRSKALELASARATIGLSMKHEERLLKAAQIMLRIGDLRQYCRFTAQAGQWERAISIAPAVSHQFWVEMCNEYVETLNAADIDEVSPYWVATGKAPRYIEECVSRGDLDTAFVIAKSESDGLLPGVMAGDLESASLSPPAANSVARQRLDDVAAELAARYADKGEPVKAAMCFLGVSASARCVATLARAHEYVLAHVVAELLQQPKDPIVVKMLAHCAERDQRWMIAAGIWQQHPEGPNMHIPLLASRIPNPEIARELCPWTPEQFQEQYAAACSQGNRPQAVLSAVCAGIREQAAELGVQALHELFACESWTVAEARVILDPLEALPLQTMPVKDIAGILSCAAYVGLVEANALGYTELMFPLAQTLRNIISHQALSFPVLIEDITLLEAVGSAQHNRDHALALLSELVHNPTTPEHVRSASEQHLIVLQQTPPDNAILSADGPGLGKLAGGTLPGCAKNAKMSVLTNQAIKGPTFALEDDKFHIALTDALGWVRVNAFSPLNTGSKLTPV